MPLIYILFELEPLEISSKESYELFENFIKTIDYPELLRFKSLFLAISTYIIFIFINQ